MANDDPSKGAQKPPPERRVARVPPPPRQTQGGTILEPPGALASATAIITALKNKDMWMAALSHGSPGTPLLVERLDVDDGYYYIVPVKTGARVTARIRIDAKTGNFLEAGGIENTSQSLPPYVPSPAEVINRLSGKTLVLWDKRKRYVRAATVGQHPVLVWKPCNESRSPFKPFYQLTVANSLVYVRIDGKHYTRLTDSSPGA